MRTSAVVASVACLLLACSGKTLGGSPGGSGGGSSGGGSGGGGACVDIDLSSYDVSCATAADCVSISAGEICPGTCTCGGAAINAAGQARYEQAISGVALGQCFCPEIPAPQCIAGVCSAGGGTTTTSVDASTTTTTADAAACVDVDLSTYSESCSVDTDCVVVTSGNICTGSCACGGSVISASEQSRYDQAIQGIQTAECPCPSEGTPRCLGGTCTLCSFGPNQPPGCGDGG